MSSNSWPRIFATAPIVSALRGREAPSARAPSVRLCPCVATAISPLQVAELVLADLDLVAVIESVRLDAPAVDVGAVKRPEIVDVVAVLAIDEEGVVARDRDVVEEDRGVGRSPDAHPVLIDREALTRPSAAGPDDQRGADAVDLLLEVDRLVLPRLVDAVAHRGRRLLVALGPAQVGPALLAVVGPLRVDEAAFGAVNGRHPSPLLALPGGHLDLAEKDVGEGLDVAAGDHGVAGL